MEPCYIVASFVTRHCGIVCYRKVTHAVVLNRQYCIDESHFVISLTPT